MRYIELVQGSQEWLDWRKGILTATDAGMLLGVSPYTTPFKGWQRKVGQAEEQAVNPAMLRGQRDEPIARAKFIEQYGINMTPRCIQSESYTFLGASLDGISDCGEYLLEVKSRNIDIIKDQGIPQVDMCQIQHQLLCTDNTAKKCFYVTICEDEIYTIEVLPDPDWVQNYIPKAREFWKGVIFFEPPAMTSKDYRDMNENSTWYAYANEYKKLSEQIKTLEDMKDSYKNELVKLCGNDSCFGGGIKVLNKTIKGRIDYDSVPELTGIDLEKYRKKSTSTWSIMLDRK